MSESKLTIQVNLKKKANGTQENAEHSRIPKNKIMCMSNFLKTVLIFWFVLHQGKMNVIL